MNANLRCVFIQFLIVVKEIILSITSELSRHLLILEAVSNLWEYSRIKSLINSIAAALRISCWSVIRSVCVSLLFAFLFNSLLRLYALSRLIPILDMILLGFSVSLKILNGTLIIISQFMTGVRASSRFSVTSSPFVLWSRLK